MLRLCFICSCFGDLLLNFKLFLQKSFFSISKLANFCSRFSRICSQRTYDRHFKAFFKHFEYKRCNKRPLCIKNERSSYSLHRFRKLSYTTEFFSKHNLIRGLLKIPSLYCKRFKRLRGICREIWGYIDSGNRFPCTHSFVVKCSWIREHWFL